MSHPHGILVFLAVVDAGTLSGVRNLSWCDECRVWQHVPQLLPE
jgi:hypothetical protein